MHRHTPHLGHYRSTSNYRNIFSSAIVWAALFTANKSLSDNKWWLGVKLQHLNRREKVVWKFACSNLAWVKRHSSGSCLSHWVLPAALCRFLALCHGVSSTRVLTRPAKRNKPMFKKWMDKFYVSFANGNAQQRKSNSLLLAGPHCLPAVGLQWLYPALWMVARLCRAKPCCRF